MKTITLTLITILALTGCAMTTPTPKPFVCTSSNPDVCALERRVHELEGQQKRDKQRRADPVYQQMCRDSWIFC